MTTTASRHSDRSLLQAVIEEARQHARRRRRRYVFVLLLLAGAGVIAYTAFSRGTGSPVTRAAQRVDFGAVTSPAKNGPVTIMDLEGNARGNLAIGVYGISTVDRGGELHTLVRCPHNRSWCGELESIDWSPDGRRLAYSVTSFANANPSNGLHVLDLRTDRDIRLRGAVVDWTWEDLDWSPDGQRLAYSSSGKIKLVDVDGSGNTVLPTGTVGHDNGPSWSPNGAWIAYGSRANGHSSIYVIRVDGSQRRMLVPFGATPAWSPDGKRIAFRGHNGIQFVSPNGKLLALPFRAGSPVGINGPPVWSPDGKKIAMSMPRYGTYVMNADGTGLTHLTPRAAGAVVTKSLRPTWRPLPDR